MREFRIVEKVLYFLKATAEAEGGGMGWRGQLGADRSAETRGPYSVTTTGPSALPLASSSLDCAASFSQSEQTSWARHLAQKLNCSMPSPKN